MANDTSLRLPLEMWVKERLANCLAIARLPTCTDPEGWLEDSEYFEEILRRLKEPAPKDRKNG